ncbi:MAG TPA: prephenate dehydratase [Chloroflexota bacterium]|nr:prephenate dehydratase [Chloroflexota bacterium]
MSDLGDLRKQIDELDQQLVALLNQRAAVSIEIGKTKAPGDVYSPAREAEVFQRVASASNGPLKPEALKAIYGEIISSSRALQAPLHVAFLGPEATFSHQAALSHFGSSSTYLAVPTIPDVFKETEVGRADYGVVPIENSIEGAVTFSLDSFVDSELQACAEFRLEIHQAVMSRVPLSEVKVVYSHPQAIGQCRGWLRTHLPDIPVVESASTVGAVDQASGEDRAAAIGPELAAARYGLDVLEPRAEDVAGNVTRFLIIGRHMGDRTGRDRTGLLFSIKDRVGVLLEVLAVFAHRNINLTKIESRPSKRKAWDYLFFVDLDAHPDDPPMREALAQLKELTVFIKVLGAWRRTD